MNQGFFCIQHCFYYAAADPDRTMISGLKTMVDLIEFDIRHAASDF